MLGTILIAWAIPVVMVGTTFLWGQDPSSGRVAVATFTGIVTATVVWMLVSKVAALPDNDTVLTVLAVELVALTAVVAMRGKSQAGA